MAPMAAVCLRRMSEGASRFMQARGVARCYSRPMTNALPAGRCGDADALDRQLRLKTPITHSRPGQRSRIKQQCVDGGSFML